MAPKDLGPNARTLSPDHPGPAPVAGVTVCYTAPIEEPRWLAAADGPARQLASIEAPKQRALADDWGTWLGRQVDLGQLAESTIASYQANIRLWLRFLEELARTDAPTPATVGDFVAALLPHRRPAAVNVLLHTVRSFYRWCESADRYPDIARAVKALRIHHDGPLPALTHNEVVSLLASIDQGHELQRARDRALVALLYGTACRCVSLERANIADVDLVDGILKHHPKGHRGLDAIAYLPESGVALLRTFLDLRARTTVPLSPEQPLFIALDRANPGARLSTRSMRRTILRLMERAGFAKRDADGNLVNPGVFSAHSLRRSAMITAADTEGMEAAQGLAGHARIETTKKAYVRAKLHQQLKRVAGKLDLQRPQP